jgi:hypothetical protein
MKLCKNPDCRKEFEPILNGSGIALSNYCMECDYQRKLDKRIEQMGKRMVQEEQARKTGLKSNIRTFDKSANRTTRKIRSVDDSKTKDMFEKRRSKYGSTKQTFNGRSYDSILEANYASQLETRKMAGEILEIFPQYKLDLRVNGLHITNYFIDFKVVLSDNSVELIEVKGFETDVWRLKWRLTQALLEEIEPGAKLILVK